MGLSPGGSVSARGPSRWPISLFLGCLRELVLARTGRGLELPGYFVSVPDCIRVIGLDSGILAHQRGIEYGGLGHDETIEWVACPALRFSSTDNGRETGIAEDKAEIRLQGVEHRQRRLSHPSDLVEILQLEPNHGRDADIARLHQ